MMLVHVMPLPLVRCTVQVAHAGVCQIHAMQDEHGDMLLVDAAEGYEHLWRKVWLWTASTAATVLLTQFRLQFIRNPLMLHKAYGGIQCLADAQHNAQKSGDRGTWQSLSPLWPLCPFPGSLN